MAHSILLWLEAQSYWAQILVGSDVSRRGCAYTVLQTVQRHGVCIIKNLGSYSIRLGHSPFLSSRYCHDSAGSNVKQYSLEITTRV